MPVVGAVLVVAPGTDLAAVSADPRFTVGQPAGSRVPVVLETTTRREDVDIWERVVAIPGVLDVQPVFADFSDLPEVSS
jgi:hypothetical protein